MTNDIKSRLFGLLLVIVGGAAGWFFILRPLAALQNHGPETSSSLKAFVFVPFCIVYGLAFLILGAGMKYRNDKGTNFSVLGWAVLIIATLASGLSFFWYKQQVAA